jgi:hypothetical protein
MVAITAAAVYLGLNFLLPKHAKEATAEGVTSDQVFGSTAAPAGAPETTASGDVPTTPVPAPTEQGSAASPASEAAAPAPSAAEAAVPAASEPTTPVSAPAETASAEPAPAPAAAPPAASSESTSALDQLNKEKAPAAVDQPLTPEEARKIAEAVRKGASAAPAAATATAPSPAPAAAPAAAPASDGLSAEEARKIAENVSREVATRVAESSTPEPAPAPSVVSSSGSTALSEADVRRIAAEVARQVVAENRGSQHSAPAAETAAAPASPPAHRHRKASSAAPAPSSAPVSSGGSYAKYKSLPADALHAWWPTGQQPADQLNLLFAGQASTEKAIVLSFNSEMAPAGAGSHIKLIDSKGVSPKGSWAAGNNGRVLVYKVGKPGRYTLVLSPDLADAGGKTLGKSLHGPVYVQ